ncbi:MAG: short-chain dehydrogenase [Hydrocarboniphaga sp.]|uniref:SDR family oxidoreductase n=1 Tax=Hydrocarboniphaga sp. TaxID=2033016 RepID=UPI00262A3D98|nr:SDR family NAD(P)-dependent oxidoreductase [Hydrocarboniphaga sp.]MDB5968699.1 short-chain dehydrogenase [Hydrocarboniphaga sp.]
MSGILAGRVALVTGASSGIGEAAALALGAAGASVAVSARRADRLNDLVMRIQACGGKALALPGDVVIESVATAAVEKTIAHFGRIDILVNSAGIIQAGGVENADTAEYRRVIDINLLATVYTCKAALGPMKAQGNGDIINISSLAARKSGPIFNAYAASKHALNSMTDAMRQEVGAHGIRVCILMPGATSTEVANNISDPKYREAIKSHVGKEGAMAPGDVADAIMLMVTMPRRTNISELSIRPTIDTSA